MSAPDDGSDGACYPTPFGARVKVVLCRDCKQLHSAALDCEPHILHPDDQRQADAREEYQ